MGFSVFGNQTVPASPGSLYIQNGVLTFDTTYTVSGAFHLVDAYAHLRGPNTDGVLHKVFVYDNTGTGGKPGALVATSDEVSLDSYFSPTGRWVRFTFNSGAGVALSAGTFYLAIESNGVSTIMDTDGTGNAWGENTASVYPAASNPFSLPVRANAGYGGWSIYARYHLDTDPDFAPVNNTAPAVSGTVAVSSALASDNGVFEGWPASITYTYQWQRTGDSGDTWVDIAGETASSYTIVSGDIGFLFRCNVTATNTAGSVTVPSSVAIWPIAFPMDDSVSGQPVPSYYSEVDWGNTGRTRCGVFYVGETVSVVLKSAGATGYTVRDYYGNVVSTGSFSGTTCTPTPPASKGYGVFGSSGGMIGAQANTGGWEPGWYRIYFTGTSTDQIYGDAYGSTSFCVIRNDSRFLRMWNSGILTVPGVGAADGKTDNGGATEDDTMLAVMGVGTPRGYTSYNDTMYSLPSGYTEQQKQYNDDVLRDYVYTNSGFTDAARPRYLWHAWNVTMNRVDLPDNASGTWAIAYPKDSAAAAQGANLYVELTTGSVSGAKVNVYLNGTDAGHIVESFDNLADAGAFEDATDATGVYIHGVAYSGSRSNTAWGTLAPTAAGQDKWDGIQHEVNLLAPYTSVWEGVLNEPPFTSQWLRDITQAQKLFYQCVKGANPAATVIGPTPVAIDNDYLTDWQAAIDYGLLDWVDGVSFHAYNSYPEGGGAGYTLGRHVLDQFTQMLATKGITKPLWQTESVHARTPVYRVFHPRLAPQSVRETLLWEQYGLPKERNNYWYSCSHGFWDWPSWIECGDGSLFPQAVLHRVFSEEVFGKTHSSKLSFGAPGDDMYFGSIFSATDGISVAVICSASYYPSGSVTLTVTGTSSPLVWSDEMGKTGTLVQSSGKVTLPVADVSYLRLPAGVSVTVAGVNGFAAAATATVTPSTCTVGSTSTTVPIDGAFMTSWGTGAGEYMSTGTLPEDVTITWSTPASVNRVVVWAGVAWQPHTTLLTFDVQTTTDGTTWVTQKSVDRSGTATSFKFGSNLSGTGCQFETFWEHPGIFDVAFDSTVANVVGVRLHVTRTSYGGAPDLHAVYTGGDQGTQSQFITLQEVGIYNCPAA